MTAWRKRWRGGLEVKEKKKKKGDAYQAAGFFHRAAFQP